MDGRLPLRAGGWGALDTDLFPDWASRPILNIFTWQSFTIHALILGYVLMRIVAGDLVPDAGNLWRVAVITIAGALLGHLTNQAWGTNFWFLNVGAPDSPLEAIQYVAGPFHVPGADRGHARRLDPPPPALDAPRTRPAPVTLRLDSRSYSVSISPNDDFCAATDPSTS